MSPPKCLCPHCSDSPAFSYSELHRRECEARYVLGKERKQRQAYYVEVKKKRGEQAAQQLINDVKEAYERSRNQPASV